MTSSYTIFAAFPGTSSLYYFISQDLVYFNHITSNTSIFKSWQFQPFESILISEVHNTNI